MSLCKPWVLEILDLQSCADVSSLSICSRWWYFPRGEVSLLVLRSHKVIWHFQILELVTFLQDLDVKFRCCRLIYRKCLLKLAIFRWSPTTFQMSSNINKLLLLWWNRLHYVLLLRISRTYLFTNDRLNLSLRALINPLYFFT